MEEVDFRTKVTRAEFEALCSDLLEQVGDPVQQALSAADMTMVSQRIHSNYTLAFGNYFHGSICRTRLSLSYW